MLFVSLHKQNKAHTFSSQDYIEMFELCLDNLLNLKMEKVQIWKEKVKSCENHSAHDLFVVFPQEKVVTPQQSRDWLLLKQTGREIITKVCTYY